MLNSEKLLVESITKHTNFNQDLYSFDQEVESYNICKYLSVLASLPLYIESFC